MASRAILPRWPVRKAVCEQEVRSLGGGCSCEFRQTSPSGFEQLRNGHLGHLKQGVPCGVTTFAPILTSYSLSAVNDLCFTIRGRPACEEKCPSCMPGRIPLLVGQQDLVVHEVMGFDKVKTGVSQIYACAKKCRPMTLPRVAAIRMPSTPLPSSITVLFVSGVRIGGSGGVSPHRRAQAH